MTTPSAELAELTRLLNTPDLSALVVRVVIQGQIQIEAVGASYLDVVKVLLEPEQPRDLLQYAPASWWLNSESLFSAVGNGWIQVVTAPASTSNVVITPPVLEYIVRPVNANIGDLLVFDGINWITLPTGTNGQVLTSGGVGALPSYQDPSSAGSEVTGQITTGLFVGDVCYLAGVNTWHLAFCDSGVPQATAAAVFGGTTGSMYIVGATVDIRCTIEGGPPAANSKLYLAKSSADSGAGMGKVTHVPPEPPVGGTVNLTTVGICVDNSNYAALKTVKAILQPAYPIVLID